jgi:hypothetical protein
VTLAVLRQNSIQPRNRGKAVGHAGADTGIDRHAAWTGTHRLFAACGFAVVGNPDGGKQRVRKRLSVIGSATGAGRERAEHGPVGAETSIRVG